MKSSILLIGVYFLIDPPHVLTTLQGNLALTVTKLMFDHFMLGIEMYPTSEVEDQ